MAMKGLNKLFICSNWNDMPYTLLSNISVRKRQRKRKDKFKKDKKR